MYHKLAEFYKKHGHLRVEYQGVLYQWMVVQRQKRMAKNGYAPLTQEQIRLLEEIDFVWSPQQGRPGALNGKEWMSKYEELADFHKKHGHLKVEYQGSMYAWMVSQRRKRNGNFGLYALHTDEQIDLLDKLGFEWNPKPGPSAELYEKEWTKKYEELADFYKKHGHLRVDYQGSLYQWIRIQRRKRMGSKGYAPLTNDQIELLDAIDFEWGPKQGRPVGVDNKKWHARYEELAGFYEKHGHLKPEQGGSLYQWMVAQRRRRKGVIKGQAPLTDEQIQLLDEINFPWDAKQGPPAGLQDKRWIVKYQELAEFYKTHGHMNVEYKGSLYQWMAIQRRKCRGILNGYAPLTDEQIKLLDEIDFPWNQRTR